MVAALQVADALAELFHDACALMAEHERQRQRDRARDRREVGVAHAARGEAHQRFAALRCVDRHLFDYDRLIVLAAEDRARLACHHIEYSRIK